MVNISNIRTPVSTYSVQATPTSQAVSDNTGAVKRSNTQTYTPSNEKMPEGGKLDYVDIRETPVPTPFPVDYGSMPSIKLPEPTPTNTNPFPTMPVDYGKMPTITLN